MLLLIQHMFTLALHAGTVPDARSSERINRSLPSRNQSGGTIRQTGKEIEKMLSDNAMYLEEDRTG